MSNPLYAAPPTLVLASSSRYRAELLSRLRLPFICDVPDVDETPRAGEAPAETAMRLAIAKAHAVAVRHPDALVIGSDQVAVCNGVQLGKPGNHARALAQLQRMRGQRIVFHTAVCLLDGRVTARPSTDARTDGSQTSTACLTSDVLTSVTMRDVDDATLDAYLRAEQPYDVAGSAKVEGLGIALLENVRSDDPTALIGLPLITVSHWLRQAGAPLFASAACG
ncbi:septum formation inhibitor Maf [Robbsia andropogonis]|uniref:7-methyl-GTP pyrophosphatase n=1 Tax=Robbsia andropogonis TaxID=28092 RepID=A0A0F5K1W5_9BURK|nr:Maf family nucleotide pyrophosphatase [Robbsia andropogonis]KKB64073.1 septum formation inhibitor Maf [Robbsia andropogonis]MCP1120599.1 Maf family nucleotide pyrophosphatase [Robbsia andropogonis]MCP1128772.1 Maf family nucleotide pyrophosphatase [Robbsia andropogonis]